MVQMIFARRGRSVWGELNIAGESSVMSRVGGYCNGCAPQRVIIHRGRLREAASYRKRRVAPSSKPSVERGNNMALNSAPIRITSEIRYIHTNKAIATPSDP